MPIAAVCHSALVAASAQSRPNLGASAGYDVVTSCLRTGEDFFKYEPDKWDIIVTNLPYSVKLPWWQRCYDLGKPFALLMPTETLATTASMRFFEQYGFEIIQPARRINFKMPVKGWSGSAHYPTAWFTWKLNVGQPLTYSMIDAKAHHSTYRRFRVDSVKPIAGVPN